jgi:hypothetical protein
MTRLTHTLGAEAHLDPEAALACAVLRQALHDARSPRPDIRQDAQAFLHDDASLDFWANALGLNTEVLAQGLRAVVRRET